MIIVEEARGWVVGLFFREVLEEVEEDREQGLEGWRFSEDDDLGGRRFSDEDDLGSEEREAGRFDRGRWRRNSFGPRRTADGF